ncbi:MAG: methyltransferase domain-containing protein [Nannocystis sp.]|nr:methyltransferase domain-containing protein [Nannocystis sp.]MBA3546441.1 methyltransferase domain-containing protein [Nannocystis sp.]
MTWEPAIYDKFRAERARPFHDLLALVEPGSDLDLVDLGCGTGELTEHMHAHLRARSTLGLDSSPVMLARTCPPGQDPPALTPERLATPGLRFALQNIASFDPGPRFDLVLSNAALHWLPDHPALLGRLATMLRPGGQLAVQIPFNEHHPGHVLAAQLASEPPYSDELEGFIQRFTALPPAEYAVLLDRLGFERSLVRLQVYPHRMGEGAGVADFLQGSLLTGYKRLLSPARYREFFAEYRRRVVEALGAGPYLYAFERLLLWGRLP